MSRRREGLVPIGQFSAVTRLSIKTLRLYAERGLLEPADVDEDSGYRYYHLSQAGRAAAIRTLRAAQMPLDTIQTVLDGSRQDAAAHIAAHRDALLSSAASQQRSAALLEDYLHGRRALMPYDINPATLPEQHVASLTLHTDFASIGSAVGAGFAELVGQLQAAGAQPTGVPFIVYHDVIDQDTPGRIELCLPTDHAFSGSGRVVSRDAEQTHVAATVHRGRYSDIGAAYQALSVWMNERGHEPSGPPRETYLNDPQQVPEHELLTQVAWPICTD